jgi:alkylation response protein AidB-like acyl-CoA dehydrogenase
MAAGPGFYYQMAGSRTAASRPQHVRSGVMQAAYEAARQYAEDRKVFGQAIGEYQLTQAKLGRMAVIIQASRQFSYVVARLMAKGEGTPRHRWSRPTCARPPSGSPARPCRSTAAWATPRSTT